MTEIIQGIRGGTKGAGREYKVAATQYFHRRGGKFVTIAAGKISVHASVTRGDGFLLGWANTPKDAAGQDYWVSDSTAGKSKVFVYTDLDMVYEMPFKNSAVASLDASIIGRGLDIATPLLVQTAYCGKVASPIVCVGIDTVNTTVYVKIKPAYKAT